MSDMSFNESVSLALIKHQHLQQEDCTPFHFHLFPHSCSIFILFPFPQSLPFISIYFSKCQNELQPAESCTKAPWFSLTGLVTFKANLILVVCYSCLVLQKNNTHVDWWFILFITSWFLFPAFVSPSPPLFLGCRLHSSTYSGLTVHTAYYPLQK